MYVVTLSKHGTLKMSFWACVSVCNDRTVSEKSKLQ
jgi:hypothetical protein